MINDNPSSTDLYRANAKRWTAGPSLVAKRCACGKVITAKQLKQYGCCDACFKADAK